MIPAIPAFDGEAERSAGSAAAAKGLLERLCSFFVRCKKKEAMKNPMDFAEIIATGSTPLPAEYAACKDIGPL